MEEHSIVESVLDNLPVAVFAKDSTDDFRFVLWNKKQEEVTTLRAAKALGRNDYDLFSQEWRTTSAASTRPSSSGES